MTQDNDECTCVPLDVNGKGKSKHTLYTMKKRKLEHFIDNLFKVANEKVTHSESTEMNVPHNQVEDVEDKDKNSDVTLDCIDLSADNCEYDIKLEHNLESFAFGDSVRTEQNSSSRAGEMTVKTDPDEDVNPNCSREQEISDNMDTLLTVKQSEDVKPAEPMFGWCDIEDLKTPKSHIKPEPDIKNESEVIANSFYLKYYNYILVHTIAFTTLSSYYLSLFSFISGSG